MFASPDLTASRDEPDSTRFRNLHGFWTPGGFTLRVWTARRVEAGRGVGYLEDRQVEGREVEYLEDRQGILA